MSALDGLIGRSTFNQLTEKVITSQGVGNGPTFTFDQGGGIVSVRVSATPTDAAMAGIADITGLFRAQFLYSNQGAAGFSNWFRVHFQASAILNSKQGLFTGGVVQIESPRSPIKFSDVIPHATGSNSQDEARQILIRCDMLGPTSRANEEDNWLINFHVATA